jgi:GntR family transcriptional repressor for pyruvate dehydrogenase complex
MKAKRVLDAGGTDHPPGNKEDLTQLLVIRFQEMLADGVLCPGTKLPSERELAAFFKVARSSLRQALKVLEILGVITQKVGDGSYLNRDASAVLAVPMKFLFLLDGTTIDELAELRLIMEPALAAQAAERANAADITRLRHSVAAMENSKGDPVKLVASDLQFHRAIFQASGNRLTSRIFHTTHRAMLQMITVTSQLVELEHTIAFHKPILDAIEKRNAQLASRLMREHLVDASNLVVQGREQERARILRAHMASPSRRIEKRPPAKAARQAGSLLHRK